MATSPSVANYFIGKGIVKWKGPSDVDYRHLGNAPTFELTPNVTRLDHFSSMAGIRLKDLSVVIQKQMTVRFHLEEVTPENLALALMGTIVPGVDPAPSVIQLMDIDNLVGALRLVGTNDIGQMLQVDLPFVSIAPSAAIPFIGDNAWMFLEVTGEIYIDATTNSFGEISIPITGEITTLRTDAKSQTALTSTGQVEAPAPAEQPVANA